MWSDFVHIIRCGCGRAFTIHDQDVQKRYKAERDEPMKEEWSVKNCTREDDLTDAYGDMLFLTGNDSRSKVSYHRSEALANFFTYLEPLLVHTS